MPISKIKTNSLDDTAVSNAKLGADAVDATKVADDAVSGEHIDVTAITDHTELSLSDLATTDVLLIYDASANALKKITKGNLVASQPTITSVSPSNALSGDGTGNYTFTVTGTGYESSTVKFIGNDGTEYNATSTTTDSTTQVTAVVAKSTLPTTNEPYDVKVTNSNSLTTTSADAFNIDAQPAWVTSAGSLSTIANGARSGISITVTATDPESGAINYALTTGALPGGLSLNTSTGVISGDADAVGSNTTFNFTIEARDTASNATERDFSIAVQAPQSQSFTSSGTFSVPSGISTVDVLVVAGGGGGGGDAGGGGGAGGLIYRPGFSVTPGGTVSVTVGDGGTGSQQSAVGDNGQDSVFGTLTAKGGGGGGGAAGGGNSGGSGGGARSGQTSGGASANQPTQSGESGNYGFGNPGGNSNNGPGGGGGGGAGGAGAQNGSPANGGDGGIGKAYTIADGTTSVYYAGGGAGVSDSGGDGGLLQSGGQGGGGQSNYNTVNGDGVANRGGGGGAGSFPSTLPNNTSGAGGKGVVIVRWG